MIWQYLSEIVAHAGNERRAARDIDASCAISVIVSSRAMALSPRRPLHLHLFASRGISAGNVERALNRGPRRHQWRYREKHLHRSK